MDILFLQPEFAWMTPALLALLGVWSRLRRRSFVAWTMLSWLAPALTRPSLLRRLPAALLLAALGLISAALMEPVVPFSEAEVQSQGLDIAIVMDLSASMQEVMDLKRPPRTLAALTFTSQDQLTMQAAGETRLEATKAALRDFITRRDEDRIGLVVFSDNAYVVSPMTFDYDYLLHYINFVDDQILRGEGMTAVGDGIALGNYLLSRQRGDARRSQVIMVFTDGEHNYGRDPIDVLAQSDAAGIRVHAVGVDLEQELKDREAVQRLIDAIEGYGGRYFDADTEGELLAASATIDSLEKSLLTSKVYVREAPIFHWFALGASLLIVAGLGFRAVPYFANFT